MPLIQPQARPPGGAVLAGLHALQAEHGYLPADPLRRLAAELGVSLSRLYGVATFYKAFSFRPRGRHTVRVCLGTACHIRGGERLLEKIASDLQVTAGETTTDGEFTLETVHCVGSCSMSPVVCVDEAAYGRVRPERLRRILKAARSDAGAAITDR
jgi:NADH:ubiquinone oxidoreductase subunit E